MNMKNMANNHFRVKDFSTGLLDSVRIMSTLWHSLAMPIQTAYTAAYVNVFPLRSWTTSGSFFF